MRRNKTTIAAALLMVFLLGACSKDGEDWMPEATAVSIRSVRVLTMPLSDGGSRWDIDSDADVYFMVSGSAGVLFSMNTSERKENVEAYSLPFTLGLSRPYLLPSLQQEYIIGLYDYDAFSANDLVAEVAFFPYADRYTRPRHKTIDSNSARLELELEWH